jgi:hypothetical protein
MKALASQSIILGIVRRLPLLSVWLVFFVVGLALPVRIGQQPSANETH